MYSYIQQLHKFIQNRTLDIKLLGISRKQKNK